VICSTIRNDIYVTCREMNPRLLVKLSYCIKLRSFNCPLIHVTLFCIEFIVGQQVHPSVERLPFSRRGAERDAPIAGDTGVEEGDPAFLTVVAQVRV
jgi:hypothetical protein